MSLQGSTRSAGGKNEQFHLLKISPLSPNSGNENLNLQENKRREKDRERIYYTDVCIPKVCSREDVEEDVGTM